jgi:hypothetical protein
MKKEMFISKIKSLSKNQEFYISVLGWDDGDYFKELCSENGGCSERELLIFDNFPVGKKVDMAAFVSIVENYFNYPKLKSSNGKIIFMYDIHIWTKEYYAIYNFYFEKISVERMNFFEKLFKPSKVPNWVNNE